MPVLLAVTFYRISSTYAKPRCNYSVLSSFSDFLLEKYRSFFIFREISIVCAIFGRVLDTTYNRVIIEVDMFNILEKLIPSLTPDERHSPQSSG